MQTNDTPRTRLPNTRKDRGLRSTCEHCRREFSPKRQTLGRFCSRDCYWSWWRMTKQREASGKGLRRLEELKAVGADPRATEQAAWKRRMAFRNLGLSIPSTDDDTDDAAWAERGSYWQAFADPSDRPLSLWQRPEREPLVLTGHGVRLRIRHGALEIRHGFTHYPQKAMEQLLFPGDRRMPSRIVLIDPDGMVTFDVMEFLSRHSIPLVVLDWRGRVVTSLGGRPGPTDLRLREAQLAAVTNGTGLRLSNELIKDKLRGSIATLRSLPTTPRVGAGIGRVSDLLGELDVRPPLDIDSLRMLEARAANAYFASWLDIPIRWKGTGRRPIPPEWYRMPLRSSLFGDRNRHATHPVMAALNYGFGVLESQVRASVLGAGLDPMVGYLHASRPGRHALVFDLMEPLRPLAERAVLKLIREHTFSSGDVFLTQQGVCRLHPQLARAVAGKGVVDSVVRQAVEGVVDTLVRASAPRGQAD